jgi:hypothetical protein
MSPINRKIVLAARPVGLPKESDFQIVEIPTPTPDDGQVLIKSIYISVDPYMRGRMRDAKSYVRPISIGEVMSGGMIGKIVESRHNGFPVSEYVEGMLPWQEYSVSDGSGLRRIDSDLAPLSTALGVLGMPGFTAYFGLLDICDPKPGETVVVSGAAGAVGSTVGQIARIRGCRVVGIAGSDEKIQYIVDELGFDAAFNYKTVWDYRSKLAELCPNGIDAYFDNVGGPITDAVFTLINSHARISVCGQISQYNLEKPEPGPRLLPYLLVKQAKAQGFLVFQYAARYDESRAQLADWLRAGKLKHREDIVQGFENTPRAFIGMLQGQNIGKQLVQVAPV